MDKEELNAIYGELRALFNQRPVLKNFEKDEITNRSFWEHYNGLVGVLNEVTGKDYSRYAFIKTEKIGNGLPFIYTNLYITKLSGLLGRVHAQHFSNQPSPFDKSPTAVTTMAQNQTQSIEIALEINTKLTEIIPNLKADSKERKFAEKLKASLGSITSFTQLLIMILTLAEKFGLDIPTVLGLFK